MKCDHWSQRPVVLLPGNLGSDDVLSQDPRDDGLHLHEAKLVSGTAPYAGSKWHVGKGLVLEGAIHGVESFRIKFLWIWERPLVAMQQWQQYGYLCIRRYFDPLQKNYLVSQLRPMKKVHHVVTSIVISSSRHLAITGTEGYSLRDSLITISR